MKNPITFIVARILETKAHKKRGKFLKRISSQVGNICPGAYKVINCDELVINEYFKVRVRNGELEICSNFAYVGLKTNNKKKIVI